MIRRSPFAKYGAINFSVFLMVAMFSPIHQYPFGMLMVALSIYYIRVALRERKDMFYNATI